MVSRNNQWQHLQASARRVPHYGLRKLSIGVASVLLSTTLYMGVSAHADTVTTPDEMETTSQATGSGVNATSANPVSEAKTSQAMGLGVNAKPSSGVTETNNQVTGSNVNAKPNGPASEATTGQSVPSSTGSTFEKPADSTTDPKVGSEVPVSNATQNETVDSQWTIHYVNQADHKQELKAPTVITLQYARTNTSQSDGTTQYGDWSYVPGSFKQTGTPITVNDSDNPVKQDDVDKNGENMDVFTITAMYPTVTGYGFYNGINGTRLHDNLRNDNRQADVMSKDFYAEYDVAQPMSDTVTSKWTIHYVKYGDHHQELKAPTVITQQYTRTNTLQSNGKIQYGDWSYVPGSFKLTGTPIAVNGSDNPTKEDNVDKDGKNYDVFSIIVSHPDITGYELHNATNGVRISDLLQNDDSDGDILVMSPTMNNDRYVEYDVAKERSIAVKFVDDQYLKQQVGQAVTVTGRDGDTVDLKLTVPDKYKLADGQQLPTTYTFTKDSGDLTIHLVHQVVQREAAIDVQLALKTAVRTRGDDGDDAVQGVVTQTRWKQLEDSFGNLEHSNISFALSPLVEVGTLTGHVDYDLVDETVVSLKNDWTSLNLSGHSYKLPNGTEVVNGIRIDASDTIGKKLRDDWYLNKYRKWHSDVDPDYITRPWHGYLSVNATNNSDDYETEYALSLGLQAGLVGNEPNALAQATGDRAATAVEMSNKPIDLNLLRSYDFDFSEQDGQLRTKAILPVAGVYIPYVEKTATRTINVITPDGKKTAVKQTATLAKQVDFGKDAHPAWTTGEWANYDVPTIPGYTASQSQIAKTAVTGTTEDQTVNITYTANSQTSTVVYQTEDGTPVHTTTVNGQTGQTVKVSSEVPAGWKVINGKIPSEITFGSDETPKTVVTIAHSHVTVTSDAPKTTGDKLPDNPSKAYPAGVSETDLNKTVTRTIKVTTPDGQTKTIAQTAKLTRTADVDEVTGEVKYSDWTTGEWDKYDVLNMPGYTASQPNIADQTVTGTTKDVTVTIIYTANEHQISIEYVNSFTGQVVKTDHVSGKTGQTVSITPHIPDGWELLSGQSVPSEVTLGADGAPATVIKVQPQERSVAVKFVDDQLYDQPYKQQVVKVINVTGRDGGTVDLHLTVPDKYQLADGQQLPIAYTFEKGSGDLTIHLVHQVVQREATIDVQLGLTTIVYSNDETDYDGRFLFAVTQTHWKQLDDEIKDSKNFNSDKVFPSVKVGTLTGHVNYDLVDNKVVSFKDDWTRLNLDGQTYQMPDGTDVVNGVLISSLWGKSFKEQLLKYHPDADPDYVNRTWYGYLSVNATNEIDLSDFTGNDLQVGLVGNEPNALAKATGDQAATAVKTANKTIDSNWLKGKFDMQQFSEQNGQLRADAFVPVVGAYIPYVEKTVTRTINITLPDGKTTAVKQTATLAKQIDFGKDAHPAWTTGEWASYDAPTIPGYMASQPNVVKETVTGTTEDQTINITYTANPQTTTVVYQTGNGTPVHTTTVKGQTGQTVKVPNEVPTGWHIINGEVPSELTFEPNGVPKTVVTIDHSHVTVIPDAPKTPADKLPDNPDKSYPAGVSETDLNKTVTRTIKVTTPDGQTKAITQTAKLTRTADVDEVTGEVTYGKWLPGELDAYEVPTVDGYTATQTSVAATPVDEHTADQTVEVSYSPNKQTTTVKYVDDEGQTIHTTTVDGATDQTVKVPSEVPAGWMVTKGKVPSEITFGADGHEPIEVTVAHQHVTVTSDHPQTNGTKLPDNPAKTFNGVEANDLNKTITRTIKVTTPDGQTKTVAQTAKLTRTADVDEVTGEVTYGKWTTGEWNTYEVPVLNGYTASQTSVEATPVDENTKDQTVEVSYMPNKQSTTIKYVDGKGDVVHTTTVIGKTDQTVKVPNEVPIGWTITSGQVPNEITFGSDGHYDVTVTVGHQHVTVTPDKPQNNGTKLPDNPVKTFNGVEANDLNKTITRTIKVTTPDGQTKTVAQSVKLTRTADVDEVTGAVTYGNWTTGEWAAYDAPIVAGYTPSQATVAKESVTATSKDTTVEISYLPMQHQISVEYVDDDDHGKIIKTDQVPGKTDQTITVTPSAPVNYDLVDNGNRTYTVTSDDAQAVQIHVKHNQVVMSESKTVTRTINVHMPHDGVKTIKQTAELTRKVTTDQVTGKKTYGDWSTGQWAAYTPEAISGYTPSTNEVPNVNIDGSSKNQMVDVTYTADAQKVEIVYVDDTKGDSVVKTDQLTGKTDETVKVTPDVPAGYELVGKVPSDYTMTADGHQTITVHLVHQMKTASESKTVTRTINVHTPHDGVKTIKQTAELTRNVTTDQVTGNKTYGDWSTTEWDRYAVPAVAGYVPSIEQVAQQVVNGTTVDQTIDVTYSSGEHTAHINYVDGAGNTVHTTTIKGRTDGTVQVPNETPAGWTVVGEPVPTELAFGSDGHADVIVTIDHQHVTITPDQPKTPTDKLPDSPAKTYPNGVGYDDLNKTVTRTIKVTTSDGQTKTVAQTVKLTRTADVDEVTGKVAYGKWTTGEWSGYEVPVVPGYTSTQSEVPATKVTDDTKDQTVTVTYTANDQTTHINYVDDNGETVHTTTITGKTDQTVKVPNEVPTGWKITDGQVPSEVTFGANGHSDVTVTVDHQHVTVTPDRPQTDGTKLPDNPIQTFHGVTETDLNKVVTRTIEVAAPARKTTTVKQTAKLTRTADVDEVTGEVTYGAWSTGNWDAYQVPVVPGYMPSQSEVPAEKVTDTTKDQTVTVTYTANDQVTHVNYVDGNGKIVHKTTVTGKTDQTVKVPNEVPTGWKITSGQVPNEITLGADGHSDVTVTVDHQYVTVTPDRPQTDGTKLPDNDQLTFNGVGESDLNKVATRTIEVTTPAGKTDTITQTVKLTRTATVDEVTGKVTYGTWSTGNWDAYQVPALKGYTASQTTVAATPVTSDTLSQTVKITYTADQGTVYVTYVDEAGHPIHTTTVTGATGQTVKVPKEIPAGWVITKGDVPTIVTVNGDETQTITITVQHRTVTVEPNQPQPEGTPLPDNPSQHFTGVESGDLNKTITRTIIFNVPGQDPRTITQTAKLTRTATVDEVTGEVTYGDWTTAQWPAVTVPAVDGYTTSQTQIPAVTVGSKTDNQTVTVDYQAVEVPTTPTTIPEARPMATLHTSGAKSTVTPAIQAKVASSATEAPAAKASQLPQTGSDETASAMMTSLGLLMGALSAFALGRKKKNKGRKA